jgi:hypothetical protein
MNTVDQLAQWNGVVKSGGRLNVSRALQNQTVCSFVLSAGGVETATPGGNFSVGVTAPQNCDFSAVSQSSWITVTSGNPGSGNTNVNFTVAPNTTGQGRGGTILIAGQNFLVTQREPAMPPAVSRTFLDFDFDGRTDYVAIQNVNGMMTWHTYRTVGGYSPVNFGLFADDVAVPADYDGDGKTDVAVWRSSNGTFYVLQSLTNAFQAVQFGQTGDNPTVSQDFDGDQKADFAVTRAVNGNLIWYVSGSASGFRTAHFGIESDKPVRGDFDGDGKADYAVYRPASASPANTFFIRRSSDNNLTATTFGISATDKIVAADYDGDRQTDIAVWRTTNGTWYHLKSTDGSFNSFQFGTAGDLPTPGDYDGDGKTDFAVWRPNANPNQTGEFYIQKSTAGFSAFGWGNSQMKIPANSILPE